MIEDNLIEEFKAMAPDKVKKSVSKKISDPCPECGRQLVSAGMGGGVKCSSMKCGYWFCF